MNPDLFFYILSLFSKKNRTTNIAVTNNKGRADLFLSTLAMRNLLISWLCLREVFYRMSHNVTYETLNRKKELKERNLG